MKEYDPVLIGTGQATGVMLPALMELGRDFLRFFTGDGTAEQHPQLKYRGL